jgi:Prokaryotic N-terminal methylation motif
MTRTTPMDRRAGLTLAELLIALVIGGMTLIITAQASSNVRRWTGRLGQAEKSNTRAVGLYQFTEKMLADALPMTHKVEDKPITLFAGNEHAVRFVRAEPGYPSRAGIYQYYLYSIKSSDGKWAFNLERELLSDPDQFGTMKNPARLNLYTDTQPPVFVYGGNEGWQTDWVNKEMPPNMVSFGITKWPSLSIALPRPAKAPPEKDKKKKKNETAPKPKVAG